MNARIYCPAPSAAQSGPTKATKWVLEFEPTSRRTTEPLMGWTSSADMNAQVKLKFDTKEEAIAYAQRNGIVARIELPAIPSIKAPSYYNNFATTRKMNWTH